MKAHWQFSIEYSSSSPSRTRANGFFARSADDVDTFSELAGSPVSKRDGAPRRSLRVDLPEDDARLQNLLQAIKEKYNFEPSPWFIVPVERRSHFFGLRKRRTYNQGDIDGAPFLSLFFAGQTIAKQADGTDEQIENETYVVEIDESDSDVQLGTLMPFHGLCVSEVLGNQIEASLVRGLSLEPVAFSPKSRRRHRLLKLSSKLTAPRCLLRLVDEQGQQIEPNTSWSCYFDDDGYQPYEFRYPKEDQGSFESADILVTFERTGVTKARAYRWVLVSQRFRQLMTELKVPGMQYAPVRFVD